MDASGWYGKRFQVRERSGGTETLFLCAPAPEFFTRGGLVYPNPAEPGNHGDVAGARGARTGRESCPVRSDRSAGTGGSLHIAAAGGGNISWGFRWTGAAARCHRTVWRDVVCGVTERARTGAAHGAWRRRIQSASAGTVAWLGVNRGRCGPWCGRSTWVDAAAWEPPLQGESARSSGVRLGRPGAQRGLIQPAHCASETSSDMVA